MRTRYNNGVETESAGFILPDNSGLTARALLGPLIADAPIGLALVDSNFCYVFINETQAGFNERPVHEHLGRTVSEVLGDVAWEQMASFFQRSLTGHSLRAQEVTIVSLRQPGVQRHYLVSLYPVRSDRRTVTGVGTVVTDITERKQNEALISGQNRLLEGIATDVPLLETLTALADLIEEQLPHFSVMVLQTRTENGRLQVAAAPRLSCDVASEIWGDLESSPALAVGGETSWPLVSVEVPLSRDSFGRKGAGNVPASTSICCLMTPILGEKNEVLGVLGTVLPETHEPTARELSLLGSAVNTARIAMERDRELVRRRQLLRDMLGSLTEKRLVLCLSPGDLPVPFSVSDGEAMALSTDVLRDMRRRVSTIAERLNMPEDRRYDLEVAVGEASMNAVVHAGTGTGEVFVDEDNACIQVWIRDTGTGIAEESLHRATLERGFSTGGTLGHGFWMILNTIDKVYLLTGLGGTTIVLEHRCQAPDTGWMDII